VHPVIRKTDLPALAEFGGPDSDLENEALCADVLKENAGGVIITQGSVFSNAGGAFFTERRGIGGPSPAEIQPAIAGAVLPRPNTSTPRKSPSSNLGGTQLSRGAETSSHVASTSTLATWDSLCSTELGPLILPRVRSQQKPASGSVATRHIGAGSVDAELHNAELRMNTGAAISRTAASSCGGRSGLPQRLASKARRPSQRSAASVSKVERLKDRKWHLRHMSLSAAIAQEKHEKATSRPATAATATGGGPPAALQSSEYLSFEGWCLDDDYLCPLLSRAPFPQIRHINMSGNRLTETVCLQLLEVGRARALVSLESLRLASNRLGHSGGSALATLIKDARPPLCELDLADNQLGDKGCEEICEALGPICTSLVGLSLASNDAGHCARFGSALGTLVGALPTLQALDLHWNSIHGLGAAALVQGLYDNACSINGNLWRVNLAWNRLGLRCNDSLGATGEKPECRCEICRACSKVISTLASVFADGKILFHLDVSYNSLRAVDCAHLGESLKHNHTLFGLHLSGNEASIDDVGFVIPNGAERDLQRRASREDARFGLNNSIRHTPRCLRLERVSAFNKAPESWPVPEKAREMAVAMTRTNPALHNVAGPDAFSSNDIGVEKEWVQVHSKVQAPADFGRTSLFEDVRVNERCCWICENWVELALTYIPGWSGPEKSLDEATNVFVFFSSDGFTRPVRLARTTERYYERQFSNESAASGNKRRKKYRDGDSTTGVEFVRALPAGQSRTPICDADGRYVVFTGARMLPPSTIPVHLLFQVNEDVRPADHMMKQSLPKTQEIMLHQEGRTQGVATLPKVPVPLGRSVSVSQANVVNVGTRAWRRFEAGIASTLCLMEDPRHRTDLEVVPRRLQFERVKVVHAKWKFETSVFQDYVRETEKTFLQCFDLDYSASKLEKFVDRYFRGPNGTAFRDYLRGKYRAIMAAYHGRSFRGFELTKSSAGLSLLGFADLFTSRVEAAEPVRVADSENADVKVRPASHAQARSTIKTKKPRDELIDTSAPIYSANFVHSDGDRIFIGANVLDKDNKTLKAFAVMPNQGLARFQFLEAIARVALARFYDNKEKDSPQDAIKELLERLNFGNDQLHVRKTLQQALFCEECCMVVRQNRKLLEETFACYAKRMKFPGRGSMKFVTYGAWLDFAQACNAHEYGVPHVEYGLAFALGKEIRVDEYKVFRHMELSWSEFVVCIGALVRLSGKFKPEMYADDLSEFIDQHVSLALLTATRSTGRRGPSYSGDPIMSKILQLVGQVFEEADEDCSGHLSFQEFNNVLRRPEIAQGFKDVGIGADEFKVLFVKVDVDKSGAVTLNELCDGLVKMKKVMVGLERACAYLRKIFSEADYDGSGTLSKQEFFQLLQSPGVQQKLQAIGVSIDDVDDLWAAIDAQDDDGEEGVSADEMIAGFLLVRESGGQAQRGVNFIRQCFKAADTDNGGALSRSEYSEAFCAPSVKEKLEKLGLQTPDWLSIFDAVDINNDGELSWDELRGALVTMWQLE